MLSGNFIAEICVVGPRRLIIARIVDIQLGDGRGFRWSDHPKKQAVRLISLDHQVLDSD